MSEKMPSPEKLDEIQKENLTDEQIVEDKKREETYEAGRKSGLQEAHEKSSAGIKEKNIKIIKEAWKNGDIMLAGEKDGKRIPVSYKEVMDSGWDCKDAEDPEVAYAIMSKLTEYKPGQCIMAFTKENPKKEVCLDCDLHMI